LVGTGPAGIGVAGVVDQDCGVEEVKSEAGEEAGGDGVSSERKGRREMGELEG